jgi:hypothetical protein
VTALLLLEGSHVGVLGNLGVLTKSTAQDRVRTEKPRVPHANSLARSARSTAPALARNALNDTAGLAQVDAVQAGKLGPDWHLIFIIAVTLNLKAARHAALLGSCLEPCQNPVCKIFGKLTGGLSEEGGTRPPRPGGLRPPPPEPVAVLPGV